MVIFLSKSVPLLPGCFAHSSKNHRAGGNPVKDIVAQSTTNRNRKYSQFPFTDLAVRAEGLWYFHWSIYFTSDCEAGGV